MTAFAAILPRRRTSRFVQFLKSCVASPGNVALTLAIALLLGWLLPGLVGWALFEARWSGAPALCDHIDGACWIFVAKRWPQLVYGAYPAPERWRADLLFLAVLAAGAALLSRRVKAKGLIGAALIVLGPPAGAALLLGGIAGLTPVPVTLWGGLLLTVVVAGSALAGALPVGLALALARRSELPAIRILAIGFIEFWRGVPLVAVLFMAMAVLPLLLPPGSNPPPLMRVIVAFVLFNGAAMAEVFRGGLQAIPPGQFEAARSLGLSRAKTMALVVLPQAIAMVVPGLLNVAVAIVKETTLVLIIGLFDFLNEIEAGLADPQWLLGDQIRDSAYLFAGVVFWAVCFGLSRVSARLELARERRA